LSAEIGSTITKVSAFGGIDTDSPAFLGQGLALTTVADHDVTIGLRNAMDDLASRFGVSTDGESVMMASSSAAGGLRMTVHGLTRDMTLRAAREASLGAGAVIVHTTAGKITADDVDEITKASPKLILLSGGVDFGEKETVIKNARMLFSLDKKVVYAGNVSVRKDMERIFSERPENLFLCDNVYPRIDELNIEPVRAVIRKVFSDHIVTAPGMERVKTMVAGDVIPTPAAVMGAAELLYDEIGDLVVVDVGGATTDVHSVTEGSNRYRAMMVSPEPLAKRTVEGDLGVFINAGRIVEESGGTLNDIGEVTPLPEDEREREKIKKLAQWAVDLAVWRHAGEIKVAYGAYGRNELVEGKDLTVVDYLIGTGGALTRLGVGRELLSRLRRDPKEQKLLPPKEVEILVDEKNLMAAAGTIKERYPELAKKVLFSSLGL
jgi:uncharacterized protein (TIGR01319 family)